MQKREAQFTLLFRHWLKAHPMESGAFELKQTQSESISFTSVEEHQIDALLAVKSDKGLLYKIPDDSPGYKPFDLVYYKKSNAYVVIKYPKFFTMIDVNIFVLEKERSKRKSLTSKRAIEIAHKTVTI